MNKCTPTQIILNKNKRSLKVVFNKKQKYNLTSELLRIESPSAEVQNHGGPKIILRNKKNIEIIDLEIVGNYAIRIIFSDKHNSGLYTWDKLFDLAQNQESYLKDYYRKINEFKVQ